MAPTKSTQSTIVGRGVTKSIVSMSRRAIPTRTQQQKIHVDGLQNVVPSVSKRKADISPLRNDKSAKRSALGNVTHAVLNVLEDSKKLTRSKTEVKKTIKVTNVSNGKQTENEAKIFVAPTALAAAQRAHKIVTRSTARTSTDTINPTVNDTTAGLKKINISTSNAAKVKKKTETLHAKNNNNNNSKANAKVNAKLEVPLTSSGSDSDDLKLNARRLSNEFDLFDNEDSHYMSALEDLHSTTSSMRLSVGDLRRKSVTSVTSDSSEITEKSSDVTSASTQFEATIKEQKLNKRPIPADIIDFDREIWDDPTQVPEYAYDIFNYLKEREDEFQIDSYLERQPHLTRWMRTLLVDWMVEVQESFEMNHETLYLAVKIVDVYLSKIQIVKEKLQLVGCAALFLSSKYDERIQPMITDFLFICDGAYKQNELIRMEMDVFRTIGYDLGIPLSYRFLRRYARCAKVTMPELTLARFILEFSLMNYDMITMRDSKVAAASLFMALRMNHKTGWNKTLQYYTGYKLSDFESIIPMLNGPLHQKPRDANKTIRNKYTHELFHEVSKVPLMTNEQLLESSEQIETL